MPMPAPAETQRQLSPGSELPCRWSLAGIAFTTTFIAGSPPSNPLPAAEGGVRGIEVLGERNVTMPKRHVRRSGLTMPVNNPRFLNAIWTRGCDFVNLDLEDSVPESQKPYARSLIKSAIPTTAKGGAEVFVRINHAYVRADLEAVVWPGLARVNYPKAETAEEIRKLDAIITELERERGIRPGSVEIGANIETARGVANGPEIASASPRVKDFGGGTGYDMSRDLGVEMFVGFDQFVY